MDAEGAVLCRACHAESIVAAGADQVRQVAEGAPIPNFLQGVGQALALVPLAGLGGAVVALVVHAALGAVLGAALVYVGGALALGLRARRGVSYGLAAGAFVVVGAMVAWLVLAR